MPELVYALGIAAMLVEAVITYTKAFVIDASLQWQQLAGIGLGVLVAFCYRLDLFAALGLTAVPWLGWVGTGLTGVLISRGSNYLFDLVSRLTKNPAA